ncbi:DinB family protein [Hymenobacter terrestris]|uniref:DinB family protein n=1 Tax=Hymenobacter terrestris TaxID=2748310 RepID=A0ABX2PY99_9BACT|nr:DinB family protein [Hymenobacter terrestris]NVO83274.1 DinB family protein [Hymenobacter terrestris]
MSAYPTATTEFLDALTADVERVREVANRRFRTLGSEQLNRGPGPGRWSVGQCLEHLNLIGGLYLPVISRKIQAAQQRGTRPATTVKHGYFGQKLTAAMRVPATEKPLKSPQQYAPSGSRLPGTVVEVFTRQLDELSNLLSQARRINMNAIRIANPVIPLLLPPLPDVFELLVEHLKRHLLQAERVLDGLTGSE